MSKLQHLIDKNRAWSDRVRLEKPEFFSNLSRQQEPEYLWIGCSDSRVSADAIVDLLPGEIFVHRNVANLVIHTDLNCLSVIQYAVDVLKVKHIIICGHYGCGGIKATLNNRKHGLIDNWLCHVQDIIRKHKETLDRIDDNQDRYDRLCELNVMEQVANICQTTVVSEAWNRGQDLTVHGWIYRLQDGLIKDLNSSVGLNQQVDDILQSAIERTINKSG